MKKVIIDIADNHGDAVTITCLGNDKIFSLRLNLSVSAVCLNKEITHIIIHEDGTFSEV